MIKELVVVNVGKHNSSGTYLRSTIASTIAHDTTVRYIKSSECWVEVDGGVSLVHQDESLPYTDSAYFIHTKGKYAALISLFCHMLALKGVSFTDKGNEYHSDFTDKSFAIPRMAHHGLPVPRTLIVPYGSLIKNLDILRTKIAYPCVLKKNGARGESVFLIEDEAALLAQAEAIMSDKGTLLTIQEYIPNEYDVRAMFFGTRCLGVMRRERTSHSFLNNISKGATASVDALSERELELCRKAQAVSYIDWCGIDFIRTKKGIVFLEVNKSPQINGLRSVKPELPIAEALREWLKQRET